MRFLLVLFLALAALVPLPAAAQDDRDRITRFLEDNLSDAGRDIRIEGFRGALSSRAEMDRLTIADDQGIWLTLTGVVIDWNRLAILAGNIEVTELSAREIILERPPVASGPAVPSPEARPFALPDLPVSVRIDRVAAERIVLGPTVLGQPVEGSLEASLSLAAGEGRTSLQLQRTGTGPQGVINLQSSYSNASQLLVIALEAREDAGGIAATLLDLPGRPAVQLSINGSGPMTGFDANVTLATGGAPRLAGRITVNQAAAGATRFSANVGGDVAPLFAPEQAAFFGPDVRLVVSGTRDAAGRLDLSQVTLSAQALTLDGTLVVAADGLPARFDLTGRLGLDSGDPVALPFAADVDMRARGADLSVRYDAAQGDGWSAQATVEGVTRTDVSVDRLVLSGSGRISRRAGQDAASAFGGTLTLDASGLVPSDPALARALGTALSGRLTFSKASDEDALRIGDLALTGADYRLALRGLVGGLTTGLSVSGGVEGGFDDLSRLADLADAPLAGAATLAAGGSYTPLTGAFDVTGQITGQALATGIAELDGLLRNRSTIDLSIRRDATGTLLRNLDIAAGPASLTARGTLATAGSDLTASFDLPDLSVLGPTYGGGLTARATLQGTPEDAAVTLTGTGRSLRVGQAELDRLLAGTTALDLSLTRQGERIGIVRGNITNPAITARVTGHYDPAGSDLTARVEMADIAVLGGDYAGGVAIIATAQGTLDTATATLRGTGRSLRLGQPELDGLLAGDTDLDLAITKAGDRIDVSRASFANPNAQVSVQGHYDPAGSDLSTTARITDLSRMGAAYRGSLDARAAFVGTPQDGALTVTGTGRDLRIGQAEADRLLAGTSELDLALQLRDGLVQVDRASLSNPQIQADATGRIDGDRRSVDLTARLANMALIVPDFPGVLTVQGGLAQTAADGPYQVDIRAQGPGGIDATARGTVAASFATASLQIAGTAQAGLANVFLGDRAVAGQLSFDLSLNGSPGLAALSGPVRLTGGRLSDPALPFALTDIAATATLGNGAVQVEAGSTLSSGGRVTAQGRLGLSAPYAADLTIGLANATLRDPSLYEATLGGQLRITGPLTGGGTLSGRIDVAQAELRVPNASLAGTGQIPDLRHANEPADVRATRRRAGLLGNGASTGAGGSGRLNLDITISAPARVFVRGRGLDAELGGEVRLLGTTAAVVPSGALQLIRGRLDILGERLVLNRAELLLQGDLVPTLDIAATTESDGVATTVAITGPATEPEITFSSNPELPQEEVLSRLLFGRDLSSISPLQAAQLASAVATLAGRGGEGIIGRLRKGFGLDDLDVASDGEGGTTLRAGKYISERVYTEVEVDQGGQSRINLNLDLRPGVKIKGRVSSEGEAGLGLFLERDY